jgi:hypothetical protein
VWDELNEPLGLVSGAPAAPPIGRARVSLGVLACAAAVSLGIGLIALAGRDAPLGGEPFAVAKVEVLPAPPKPAPPAVSARAHEPIAPPIASAAQVEAVSGVEVTRGSGGAPKALIIDVARALAADHAPGPDRLVERSQQKLLPRAGAEGGAPILTSTAPNPSTPSHP